MIFSAVARRHPDRTVSKESESPPRTVTFAGHGIKTAQIRTAAALRLFAVNGKTVFTFTETAAVVHSERDGLQLSAFGKSFVDIIGESLYDPGGGKAVLPEDILFFSGDHPFSLLHRIELRIAFAVLPDFHQIAEVVMKPGPAGEMSVVIMKIPLVFGSPFPVGLVVQRETAHAVYRLHDQRF